MKSSLLFVVVFGVFAGTSLGANKHCPENCVPLLAGVCDQVEDLLENVPVISKRVPFVLEVVGRAICFPAEPKPYKNSLCPSKCGTHPKSKEVFTKVCNYVDDILQATPGVPKMIRNLTDNAICAIADLIPVDDLPDGLNQPLKDHDSHCPKNCVKGMVDLCDHVEGILENAPVVNKVPFVLDLVGKAMCFPSDTKPAPDSLCPKKCGKTGDKKSVEVFTRVCNYVDSILQSTPGVTKMVRNLTDITICTIGSLIPTNDDYLTVGLEDAETTGKGSEDFCPENCDEDLVKVCKFVESILTKVPQMDELADKEIGRAICFPESSKPHEDSLCPEKCGEDESQKICEYVDLLLQVPQVPKYVRKLSGVVICELAELFDDELAQTKQQLSGLLQK